MDGPLVYLYGCKARTRWDPKIQANSVTVGPFWKTIRGQKSSKKEMNNKKQEKQLNFLPLTIPDLLLRNYECNRIMKAGVRKLRGGVFCFGKTISGIRKRGETKNPCRTTGWPRSFGSMLLRISTCSPLISWSVGTKNSHIPMDGFYFYYTPQQNNSVTRP